MAPTGSPLASTNKPVPGAAGLPNPARACVALGKAATCWIAPVPTSPATVVILGAPWIARSVLTTFLIPAVSLNKTVLSFTISSSR